MHNRVPWCPPPYIFINYFLNIFFLFEPPISRDLTFLEAIELVIYAKKIFFM